MSNPLPFIMANAVLTILAGSDTTSSSMAMIFFNLLREPRCYKKLQKEIDVSVAEAGGSIPSMEKLGQLPYLNAVMYVLSFESVGGSLLTADPDIATKQCVSRLLFRPRFKERRKLAVAGKC